MKAVVQKVLNASVTVDNKIISQIGNGLMILVGISVTDTKEDAEKLSRKIVAQRLFQEGDAHWKKSVKDTNGDILSVSQFTLMAKTTKGSKPDFHRAQKGHVAKDLYNYFLECLKKEIGDESKIKDGQFGAMMQVALTNDGPTTILIDTAEK